MDNENIKICRGGLGEKEWIYIQDDIRFVHYLLEYYLSPAFNIFGYVTQ